MKRSVIAFFLAIALLAAFAACGSTGEPETPMTVRDLEAVGEGGTAVTLLVTLPDGTQTRRQLFTDRETLGEALDDAGLIGRDSKGMLVAVEGVEASWEADQAYWAFYIGGDYAMYGVDDEVLVSGNIYEFKYTKD